MSGGGPQKGALTEFVLIGKDTKHPEQGLWPSDKNNISTAVGFSWSPTWGGKDKTIVRAGYGINYQGAASFNAALNLFTGNNVGLSYAQNFTTLGVGGKYFNFASPDLQIPDRQRYYLLI